ncbi:interleukin-23 receptor [Mustelus asterias]
MDLANIVGTITAITTMVLCVRSNVSGLSIIQCPGKVLIKPAPVFLVGSNISITCVSMEQNCNISKFELHTNEKKIQMELFNKTAAHYWMVNVTTQDSTIFCYVECVDGERMFLSAASLQSGYPPDQPKDLICIWRYNNMTCTWTAGKQTLLKTYYSIHVQNEITGNKQMFSTTFPTTSNVTVPGDKLEKVSLYKVWVQAANALGSATSKDLTFSIHDIVKPDPPNITKVEFINNSVAKTIIHWRNSTSAKCRFELRYRITSDPGVSWTLVGKNAFHINGNSGHFHNWQPFKEYEFQIRCSLVQNNNYWSDWSKSFIKKTPEAVPVGGLDVWSFCEPVEPNKHRKIIIYWKPLRPQETRGMILGYHIFYRHNGLEVTIQVCNVSETRYSWRTLWAPDHIFISAFNSKGNSTPAVLHIGEANMMAPRNLMVAPAGDSGIYVKWEPPDETSEPVLGYVVDWRDAVGSNNQLFVWKRIPRDNHSLFIGQIFSPQEHGAERRSIRPRRRYNISVTAMYQKGPGRSCSAQGYSVEGRPTTGPNISVIKFAGRQVQLKWGEIPLEKQQGFITNYTIYLKKGADGSYLVPRYVTNADVRTYWLTLDIDTVYIVHMTATTAAGEGAKGAETTIKQDYYSIALPLQLSMGITIPAAFLLTLTFAKTVRRRIKTICKMFLPDWAHEEFPNVENSLVAKRLQIIEEVPCLQSAVLLMYKDPPVTEIEEMLLPINSLIQTVHGNQQLEQTTFEISIPDVPEAHNCDLSEPNEDAETIGYKPQISSSCQLANLSRNGDQSVQKAGSDQAKECKGLHTPTFDRIDEIPTIGVTEDMNISLSCCQNGIPDKYNNYILKKDEGQFPVDEHHRMYVTEGLFQEQTLLPDELVNCLLHSEEDSIDIKSYFPQIVAI